MYVHMYIHTDIEWHTYDIHVSLPVEKMATWASRQRQQPGRLKQLLAAQRLSLRQFHRHSSVVRSILGPPLPTGPRQNPTVPPLQPPRARRHGAANANLEHIRTYADTPAAGLQVDAKACAGASCRQFDACVLICCPRSGFGSHPSLQVPCSQQPGARGLRSTREAEPTANSALYTLRPASEIRCC